MNDVEQIERSPARMYQSKLDKGVFQIQVCETCHKHVFYPRSICPHCGSMALAWVNPTGRGTVYSSTVVRTSANADDHFNVCLVDLEEGVRLMSRVEGVRPEEVRIGMAVNASVRMTEGSGVLVFQKRSEPT